MIILILREYINYYIKMSRQSLIVKKTNMYSQVFDSEYHNNTEPFVFDTTKVQALPPIKENFANFLRRGTLLKMVNDESDKLKPSKKVGQRHMQKIPFSSLKRKVNRKTTAGQTSTRVSLCPGPP